MSPRQQLDKLLKQKGELSDLAALPVDVFDEIFAFRKSIVHGKTERLVLEEIQEVEIDDEPILPTTTWKAATTLENAIGFVDGATSMIVRLHPLFGYQSDPFFTEWRGSWSAEASNATD